LTNQTLILDGELPALNEIIAASKTHWSRYSRVKRGNTQIVALECRAQKLKPVDAPVDVIFKHYRPNKKKDPDNVAGGAQKAILDGLVKARILPDDTMRYISSLHHYFEIDRKKPRIEVQIYVTDQEKVRA
jgi:Holliday junction resolvase RusA-like endonuclease